jgi:hypothetical protein
MVGWLVGWLFCFMKIAKNGGSHISIAPFLLASFMACPEDEHLLQVQYTLRQIPGSTHMASEFWVEPCLSHVDGGWRGKSKDCALRLAFHGFHFANDRVYGARAIVPSRFCGQFRGDCSKVRSFSCGGRIITLEKFYV